MKTSIDDKSDAYEEALGYYDEYIEETTGVSLEKRPSAKQKKEIVNQIVNLNNEENFDIGIIFEQHARNCFQPLYLEEPEIFSRVESIFRYFLPADHPMSDDLKLNDEDPPLCIRQLLKKPTVEQLAGVIKAFEEHDPGWCWYDGTENARKLLLALGHNFPELIKQNSRNKIIFGDRDQDPNRRPPLIRKSEQGKRKLRATFFWLLIILVTLWIINSFRTSSQNAASQKNETAKPQDKSNVVSRPESDKPSNAIRTFENVPLPVILFSTEDFTLLDELGKETTIPTGSIITVRSRSAGGTLSTHIGDKLYVGNEARLGGKVKKKTD